MGTPVRVLVVEDSLTVRRRLVEVLSEAPDLQVVGEAADGKTAIEMCAALRPDVITLDLMLPVMSGLGATEYIMAYFPTPILVVSASQNRGELWKTYDALAAGAMDVLDKPSGDEPDGVWEAQLVAAVRMLSRMKAITHPRARLGAMGRASSGLSQPLLPTVPMDPKAFRLVAIGGSTGAPGAIAELLRGLGPNFSLPILLVIHIRDPFGEAFAQWLDGVSPIRVTCAVDRQPLPPPGEARVFLAPPERHLKMENGLLRLSDEPERQSCRPSIDVLFESLAREVGPGCLACLLTGMGKDGARGLLDLRSTGALTFAQDEASSVVFGMPREAIQIGAAVRTLSLSEMAPAILHAVSSRRGT